MTSWHEVALLRLIAQRLVGPACADASDAVRWLTAVQAQDLPGALTSVALRTRSGTRADVAAALERGSVVRSWPMRGTLHLVAAEDLGWLLRLLAPRVVAASRGRRAGLGLGESDLEQGRELACAALSGGRRIRRADLFAVWDAAGLSTAGQRGVHLLSYLAMTGTLVLGPMQGGEQLIVRADDWIPQRRELEGEQALGELALRFFRSHGPATTADLIRWANLRAADARTAVALARPQLARLDVDGVEHLLDPHTPDRLEAARGEAAGVLLLPGFDEFVLGYGDRSAQLDPAFAQRVVPGGNGMFRSTVVSGGRIVATWSRTGHGARRTVAVEPFTTLPDQVAAAIPAAYDALP